MVISIGFSKPKKFMIGAWLISKWMRKPYSHVFLNLQIDDSAIIFHAAHGMVHFVSASNFRLSNIVVKHYNCDIDYHTFQEIKHHCIQLAGIKYSKFELVQIMIYDILNTIGIKYISPNVSGYICSELVGEFCINYLNKKFDKPVQLLTPSDIDNSLESKI